MKYEARVKIDFEAVNDTNYESLQAEFNGLDYHKSLRNFKMRALKLDFSKEEALLFDMLCDIKKDILELKDTKANNLLKLSNQGYSSKIGYEEIEFSDDVLAVNQLYYARLVLEDSLVAVFLKALSTNSAAIYKIKRYDEEILNHFVADTQRSLIYQKKDLNANRFDD